MEKKKITWYDNANIVVNVIIGIILAIVICSQSFAIGGGVSLTLFGSVINHNSMYLLILIYFILLKTSFGKVYFNYLNLYFMFIYLIFSIASLLTFVQSFSLDTLLSFTLLSFGLNIIMLIYLVHTFFRGTRVWKEFRLSESPFNEFTNDFFFYSIVIVGALLLSVNLISTREISGVVISTLDYLFTVLLGRYVFLYRNYLDFHKIDSKNDGNFDEVRETVKNSIEETTDIIKTTIENVDIEETFQNVKEKVEEATEDIANQISGDQVEGKSTSKSEKKKKTNKKKGEE